MINNLINLKFLPYLIFLVFPSYIIGIAVTETLLFLLMMLFFINKDFVYFKDPKVLFLIIFSLLACFSGLLNLDYNDFKIASIFHFRYVLVSVAITFYLHQLFKQQKFFSKKFLNFFIFIIFFIIIDSIFQFFFGYNFFGQEIVKFRVSGVFGDELILGSFLLYLLPLVFILILIFKFDLVKNCKYLIIFFSLYLISIYITAARTPIFLTILFVIFIIFFVKNFRNILIKSLSILVLFIIFENFFNFGKTNLFHRVFKITFIQFTGHNYQPTEDNVLNPINDKKKIENIISQTNELETKEKIKEFFNSLKIFSDDHQNHYILAFELFKRKPIIGNGPKGFRNYCRNIEYNSKIGICTTHPHNYFFQILSELGLVGLFFYLSSIFFLILKLINSFFNHRKNIYSLEFYVVSLGLLIILFPIVPSGNFFNNWISIINYYYIGFYLFFYKKLYG